MAGVAGFEIRPRGPYSLASSVRFLEGFAPAAYEGGGADHLRLAFVVEKSEEVAGVYVYSEGGVIVGEVSGEVDPEVVREQVARVLSLDVDGSGFAGVGESDPVVDRLRARYPGLRPVCYYSSYEAAAWALISNRIRIVQAARIKARMAKDLGAAIEVRGRWKHAFPGPSVLARLPGFPGLSERKVRYLRGLGRAATEGRLDAACLRSLPVEEALKRLKELPGIGDFSAELVLLRGAGEPDHLPMHEPRLGRAVALAYELKPPLVSEELEKITGRWRPYRTWVSVYLRAMLEEETREISGGGRTAEPSPQVQSGGGAV